MRPGPAGSVSGARRTRYARVDSRVGARYGSAVTLGRRTRLTVGEHGVRLRTRLPDLLWRPKTAATNLLGLP